MAAAIEVALIRLASNGDICVFVILVVGWGRVGWGRVSWCFVFRLVAGRSSGSDGQNSGDNKLKS